MPVRTRQELYERAKGGLKDPAGPRTSFDQILEGVRSATGEYLFRMTIAIQIPSAGGFRTGLYAKLEKDYFLVTAAHGVNTSKIGDVFASPRPGNPITHVDDPRKVFVPTSKPGFQEKVEILNLVGTPEDTLDLLVLKVKPLKGNPEYVDAYDFGAWKPVPFRKKDYAFIIGFPEDFARYHQKSELTYPSADISMHVRATNLAKPKGSILNYQPKWHMLMTLDCPSGKPARVGAQGVSGGSVWKSQAMKSGKIWSPAQDKLIGIQTGIYPAANVIKVTRIEHAIDLAGTMKST